MAYADFKDLVKRTASDTVLRDKAFNIAKNPKYDGYQKVLLLSMVDKFFDKKKKKTLQVVVLKMKLNRMNNSLKNYINQLKIFKIRKVYSSFIDNIMIRFFL